jgi:glycosyltransferase involved in cell wall biosynthesis
MLPSRFDTFGCVVTEAMACGLPVAAFNTKGPRDIIENGVSGVLGETAEEIGRVIASILLDPEGLSRMRERAIRRAARYSKDPIMDQLLVDMGVLPE